MQMSIFEDRGKSSGARRGNVHIRNEKCWNDAVTNKFPGIVLRGFRQGALSTSIFHLNYCFVAVYFILASHLLHNPSLLEQMS